MLTAVYCRVSTRKQDNESQIHSLRTWLNQEGVDESDARWYTDEAISGSKKSRPAWDELRGSINAGGVERVLVWRLDRMSRPDDPEAMFEFGLLVTAMQKRGVQLVTVNEGLIECRDHMEALVLMVRLFQAAMEREAGRARTRAGVAAARAKGKRIGRPPAINGEALKQGLRMRINGDSKRIIAQTVRVRNKKGKLIFASREAWRRALPSPDEAQRELRLLG